MNTAVFISLLSLALSCSGAKLSVPCTVRDWPQEQHPLVSWGHIVHGVNKEERGS